MCDTLRYRFLFTTLPSNDLDLEEFRRMVKKVLLNPSYSEKAKHYSKKLRMFGGPEKAAQLIEDFVRNRKRR